LEALLDSDELQAASENTVIAAVTFWLEEQEGQKVTREQRQRLAFQLRLFRATPWYLTRVLVEEGHWLPNTLSSEQKVVLTSAAHSPGDWGVLQSKLGDGADMNARLFGDAVEVSWWKKGRPASSLQSAKLLLDTLPGELWDKRGHTLRSQASFYNGILWTLQVKLGEAETGNPDAGFELGAFIQYSSGNAVPVAFSAGLELVGVAEMDTISKYLNRVVLWNGGTRGFPDMQGTPYTSLEDATAKLAPFTHPDGKVHIKGTILEVH
jgi:hypothetical protein